MKIFIVGYFLLVKITPKNKKQVEELFKACFNAQPDEGWYDWKYNSHPEFNGLALGIWEDTELLAHYAGFPRTLACKGQEMEVLQVGDVMVHPQARGGLARNNCFANLTRGYFSSYLRSLNQVPSRASFSLAFGFPNQRHLRQGEIQSLYREASPMFELTWHIGVSKPKRSGHIVCPEPLQGPLDESAAITEQTFNNLASRALDSIASKGYWAVRRSLSYWTWRFPPARGYEWKFFYSLDGQMLVGAAVLKAASNQASETELLDWLAIPEAEVDCMIRLFSYLERNGVDTVRTWGTLRTSEHFNSTQTAGLHMISSLHIKQLPFQMAFSSYPDPEVSHSCDLGCWMLAGDTDFR